MSAEVIRRAMYGDDYDDMVAAGVFDKPVTDCSDDPKLVREEFAADADIATQLRNFGAGQAFRYGHNGIVDYDVDRLAAEQIIQRGNELFRELPEHLRSEFGSWENIEMAAESGELKAYYERLRAAEEKAKAAVAVKSEAAKPPENSQN